MHIVLADSQSKPSPKAKSFGLSLYSLQNDLPFIFSCVFMQTNHAEQAAARTGRLRGRKPCEITENVLSQMGVHFHAS